MVSGVLTEAEFYFLEHFRCRHDDSKTWRKMILCLAKLEDAIEKGILKPTIPEPDQVYVGGPNVISDSLGEGVQGLTNMADGKQYDSKSAYRKSLKEHGMVEMGNDAPTEGKKSLDGDFDCAGDVKRAMEQVRAYKESGDPTIFNRG